MLRMILKEANTTDEKMKILEMNLEMAMLKIDELEGKLNAHVKTVALHAKEF